MTTVSYVYDGQKYEFELLNGVVRKVAKAGQLVLLLLGDNRTMASPYVDAATVAAAEAAVKAYKAGTPSGNSSGKGAPAAASNASAGANAQTATEAKPGLTVDGVISMVEAGLSDDVIISRIRQEGKPFDLSADDMIRLKKAKVSDAVMKAMMNPNAGAPSAPSTPVAGTPPAAGAQSAAASTASPAPSEKQTTSEAAGAAQSNQAEAQPAPAKKKGFWGSLGQGIKDDMAGKTVIDAEGLRNILPEFDPDKPLAEQYPHVAITVLKAPFDWANTYMTAGGFFSGCFKLQAVIWSDAATSKTVGPFDWCSPHDVTTQLGPQYILSNKPPATKERFSGYFTGVHRTDGPQPPSTLLPNDRATLELMMKNNPQHASFDLNLDNWSRMALMFANIRRGLGQIFTDQGDFRVWIVSIK